MSARLVCALIALPFLIGCHSAPVLVAEGRLVPTQVVDSTDALSAQDVGRFALPVVIHGVTLQLMADHGSNASLLTDAATTRVHLTHWLEGSAHVDTLIGTSRPLAHPDWAPEVILARNDTTFRYFGIPDPVPVDSIRIGATRLDSVVFVQELPAAAIAPFDGLIGREVVSAFDEYFDMPGGVLRLYQPGSSSWLPDGLTRSDCIKVPVHEHMSIDTTGMTADDRAELAHNPAKRMWDQRELRFPLEVNGLAIEGMFDSGAGAASMNWAAAKAVGIGPTSRGVTAYKKGGLRVLAPRQSGADTVPPSYRDSTYVAKGVSLRFGRQLLPADPIFISDMDFADAPDFATVPMINIGLSSWRDSVLFLSYSTGMVCTSRARGR